MIGPGDAVKHNIPADAVLFSHERYRNFENLRTYRFDWGVQSSINLLGFHLRFKTDGRFQGCRIAFPREARDPAQTREVMVEMVREARQAT